VLRSGVQQGLREVLAPLRDDLSGQVVRVVVYGVPDSPAFSGPLLHLLAYQAVEDVHGPLEGVHALVRGLVVPAPLVALLGHLLLQGAPARTLALQLLLMRRVELLARGLLFVEHVKHLLVRRLCHSTVTVKLLLVRLMVLVPSLLLPYKLVLDVGEVPVSRGFLVAKHFLHQGLVRLPRLALVPEVALHCLLVLLARALLAREVLCHGVVVLRAQLRLGL